MKKIRVLVLGAGFGGLELTTLLSDALGEELDLTLIDQASSFIFGYSKLDVLFSRKQPEEVRLPYTSILKKGVRFRQETILNIDPYKRRVITDGGTYEADFLVVALGAGYDPGSTPGLLEGGNEFYSVAGAEKLRERLPSFTRGNAIVGVTSTPFKCPPAPSEASLLLHDYLLKAGVREDCTISLVMPFGMPIPPSPATSKALLAAFAERGIQFIPDRLVRSLNPARKVAMLDDGTEMPYDLFLGIPRHCAPDVVISSGLTEKGWITVNPADLRTRYPNVYAIGDVTSVGTAKAGVFAETAAQVVAVSILKEVRGGEEPSAYKGDGACFIEFGEGRVGRIDVEFLTGPTPKGSFSGASEVMRVDKEEFGASRRKRWFGMD